MQTDNKKTDNKKTDKQEKLTLAKQRARAHNDRQKTAKLERLKFLEDNYTSLTFYDLVVKMNVREGTLGTYHRELGLTPIKENASKFEKSILIDDFLNDLKFDYIVNKHKFSKLYTVKVLQAYIDDLTPRRVNQKTKRVRRHLNDGLTVYQAIRAIDKELYEIKGLLFEA